jgi:hypothetical protein
MNLSLIILLIRLEIPLILSRVLNKKIMKIVPKGGMLIYKEKIVEKIILVIIAR